MKEDALLGQQAACWISPNAAALELPGYLFLGARFSTEMELESWLQASSGAAHQRPLAHSWLRATKPLQTL